MSPARISLGGKKRKNHARRGVKLKRESLMKKLFSTLVLSAAALAVSGTIRLPPRGILTGDVAVVPGKTIVAVYEMSPGRISRGGKKEKNHAPQGVNLKGRA